MGGAARAPLRPHPGGRVCAWSSLGSELETHHYGVKDKRGFKRMGHCLGRDQHFLSVNIYSSVSSVRLHIFNEVCFCLTLNSHIISDYSDIPSKGEEADGCEQRGAAHEDGLALPRAAGHGGWRPPGGNLHIYYDRAGEK